MSTPIHRTRRGALGFALAGIVTPLLATPALAARPPAKPRALSFYNLHTGESLDVTYWADGGYIAQGLRETNYLLRDFRTDEVARIDPTLLDLLHDLHGRLGSGEPFQVISGYRSPATNAALAAHSAGVAKRSLHMRGMAIDIRLPDRALIDVRRTAMAMKRGGVGYYAKSNFVHVDVGRPRYW